MLIKIGEYIYIVCAHSRLFAIVEFPRAELSLCISRSELLAEEEPSFGGGKESGGSGCV